jgi:HEAT repeats
MPANSKSNQPARSLSFDVLIGIGAAFAIVVIVILMRSRAPDDADPDAPRPLQPAAREPLKLSERMRQRSNVEPLAPRAARQNPIGEPIVVQGAAPVTPNQMQRHAGPAPGRADDAPQADQAAVPADLPVEQIDLDDAAEDVGALTKVAFADPDPERRVAAVELLSATEDPQVISVLARSLADEDEEVRMAALQALADFTGEAPTLAIEGALHDPSADIRYEAVSMLAELDTDRARAAIQQMVNDPDDDVRFLAESSVELRKPPDQESVPAAPGQ